MLIQRSLISDVSYRGPGFGFGFVHGLVTTIQQTVETSDISSMLSVLLVGHDATHEIYEAQNRVYILVTTTSMPKKNFSLLD